MKKLTLVVAIAAALAGCGENDLEKSLGMAERAPTATKSLEIIESSMNKWEKGMGGQLGQSLPATAMDAYLKYLPLAAEERDSGAIIKLFKSHMDEPKAKLAPMVLDMARTSTDPKILSAAALIYGDSRLGFIDYKARLSMHIRAWEAGDDQSAATVAYHWAENEAYDKAYLWSLRCTNGCNRFDHQIYIPDLESHLKPSQIDQIQKTFRETQRRFRGDK